MQYTDPPLSEETRKAGVISCFLGPLGRECHFWGACSKLPWEDVWGPQGRPCRCDFLFYFCEALST